MAQQLPQHKSLMFSDFGIRLRRVTPSRGEAVPVSYSHQDDYYIIGLVEKGTGCGIIDFKECRFSEGDIYLIQPGQVHRFVSSEEVEGWMLFADSSFIGSMEKNIFDNFSLFASSVRIDKRRMDELKQIASILADRIDCIADELTKTNFAVKKRRNGKDIILHEAAVAVGICYVGSYGHRGRGGARNRVAAGKTEPQAG